MAKKGTGGSVRGSMAKGGPGGSVRGSMAEKGCVRVSMAENERPLNYTDHNENLLTK